MIIYKLESYPLVSPRSALVIKETAKQYHVQTLCMSDGTYAGNTWSWRKDDCFADIDSASAALIARAESNIANKRAQLDRAISDLDVCKKWARQELLKLAATDKQQAK